MNNLLGWLGVFPQGIPLWVVILSIVALIANAVSWHLSWVNWTAGIALVVGVVVVLIAVWALSNTDFG